MPLPKYNQAMAACPPPHTHTPQELSNTLPHSSDAASPFTNPTFWTVKMEVFLLRQQSACRTIP